VKLSHLDALDDFVLLGPGYASHGRWTLLEGVRTGRGPVTVWLARYETPGAEAMPLVGTASTPELEFDVAPLALTPQLDDDGALGAIESVRAKIAQGDVYQVNYTLRAHLTCSSGAALLATLCRRAVPRFAAWVKLRGVWEFVSASPELLLERDGQTLRVEPMKGTAPPAARAELLASEKDRAELAMITDLLRDDLHRVCAPGTVTVPCARRLIELPYALQTVSDVEGQLPEGVDLPQVLAQLHPGGSITGAPRPAAMTEIRRLEPTPRDFYCGTLGLQEGSRARCALLIRTAQRIGPEAWVYGVGSGITWDSVGEAELAEIHLKLGALR
jgi:anthranilate/para-aminobenzoate synthase component I